MRFITSKNKFFIFDLQANRLAALSEDSRNKGSWTNINELNIPDNVPVKVWLKDLEFPVSVTKQVFTNKDFSTGIRFLVSNDFDLTNELFTIIYKKRWSVEEYHRTGDPEKYKAECFYRQITHSYNYYPIQSFIRLDISIHQAGKNQIRQ